MNRDEVSLASQHTQDVCEDGQHSSPVTHSHSTTHLNFVDVNNVEIGSESSRNDSCEESNCEDVDDNRTISNPTPSSCPVSNIQTSHSRSSSQSNSIHVQTQRHIPESPIGSSAVEPLQNSSNVTPTSRTGSHEQDSPLEDSTHVDYDESYYYNERVEYNSSQPQYTSTLSDYLSQILASCRR